MSEVPTSHVPGVIPGSSVAGEVALPRACFTPDQRARLEQQLTRTPKPTWGVEVPGPVCALRQTATHVLIPRYFRAEYLQLVETRACELGEPYDFKVVATLDPERGQDVSVPTMIDHLEHHTAGILVAGTGTGKTLCAYAIAAHFKRKIGVLVYAGHMTDNWREHARTVLGLTDDQIGLYQGDVCDLGKPVTLISVQTVLSRGLPPALAAQIGFVAGDECISGDALIETDRGRIRMDAVPKSGATHVLCFDEEHRSWNMRRIIRWVQRGIRPTMEVRTLEGGVLRCTPDHLLMTDRGWVEAQKLRPRDRILSPAAVGHRSRPVTQEGGPDGSFTAMARDSMFAGSPMKNGVRDDARLRSAHRSALASVASPFNYGQALNELMLLEGGTMSSASASRTPSPGYHDSINTSHQGWNTSFLTVTGKAVAPPHGSVERVYDLEVEGDHNFVANGMLVHNCHHFGAREWSTAIGQFPAAYRLGLSAEPNRKDGMSELVSWSFGQIGHKAERKRTAVVKAPTVVAVQSDLDFPYSTYCDWEWDGAAWAMGDANPAKYDSKLAKHQVRNGVMATEIANAARGGRQTIVLARHVEHLATLRELVFVALDGYHPVERLAKRIPYAPGHKHYSLGTLAAGLKPNARALVVQSDVIFSTYVMGSTALNVPKLDTLFFATPPGDPLQVLGRLREKSEGLVRKPLLAIYFIEASKYAQRKSRANLDKLRALGCDVTVRKRSFA